MMPRKLGIIAGGGRLPLLLAEHCLRTERLAFVIALKGQADAADFAGFSHAVFRLGAAGAIIKKLHDEKVQDLLFVGSVEKPPLSALRPDAWTAKFLVKTSVFQKGDDTLLRTLVSALEGEGFRVIGADDVMPGILAGTGPLTATVPTDADWRNIEAAAAEARRVGAMDQGQAAVATNGRAVAIEDRRGTAAMLDDLADGSEAGRGGVLVKLIKPGQDRRVDLPAIGPDTVAQARAAGLVGIAVSASDAVLLDREATLAAADAAGIFIVGIERP